MIKTFSLYEAATGLFTGRRLQCDDDALLEVRLPPGTLTREGAFDHMSQRVDLTTGCVVAYHPLAPSTDHEWNAASKRWQVKSGVRESEGRRAVVFCTYPRAGDQPGSGRSGSHTRGRDRDEAPERDRRLNRRSTRRATVSIAGALIADSVWRCRHACRRRIGILCNQKSALEPDVPASHGRAHRLCRLWTGSAGAPCHA